MLSRDVNNHIHTTYSFSPYSPSEAVWRAFQAGLCTAGLIDHDTIGGAWEFIKAGKLVGIGTTVGVECRADFSRTRLSGKQINNPDQASIAYVVIHGIPHTQLDRVTAYMKPFNLQRNTRNIKMVERLKKILEPLSICMNYEDDVLPLSLFHQGGTVTERHILYALSIKLMERFGKGEPLLIFLKHHLKLKIAHGSESLLMDEQNPYYAYDLLGLLKSGLLSRFYINADKECPDIQDLISFSKSIGAIMAYAYLGDVDESATGDKKKNSFEDSYLDLLFEEIKSLGFQAVTYMPSRNTHLQLEKVMALCNHYGLMQISGEDINSPRQSFVCLSQRNDSYKHLYDTAWALIGHETAATQNLDLGMFSTKTQLNHPDLHERINIFKEIGLKTVEN